MKDPFKSTPKKTKPSKALKKRVLHIETKLPAENEPATTAEPKIIPKSKQPEKPKKTTQIIPPEPQITETFEPTKLLPIKVKISLDDRMEMAKAREAITRRSLGQRKFSKTDLVNEAIINWLDQNNY